MINHIYNNYRFLLNIDQSISILNPLPSGYWKQKKKEGVGGEYIWYKAFCFHCFKIKTSEIIITWIFILKWKETKSVGKCFNWNLPYKQQILYKKKKKRGIYSNHNYFMLVTLYLIYLYGNKQRKIIYQSSSKVTYSNNTYIVSISLI